MPMQGSIVVDTNAGETALFQALVRRFDLKKVDKPEHGVVSFSSESPAPRWWKLPKNATVYSSGEPSGRNIALWDEEETKTHDVRRMNRIRW